MNLEKDDLERDENGSESKFSRIKMCDIKMNTIYDVKHIDKGDFTIRTIKRNNEILHGKILFGEAVTKFPTRTDIREIGDIVSFNPNFARMKEVDSVNPFII
jgi:hypothetical protein